MKNYCLVCLLALLMSACGGAKKSETTLTGEIKGLGNDTLYLCGDDRLYDHIDTLVVANDRFHALLPVDTLVSARVLFADGTEYPLFIGKGEQIVVKGAADALQALHVSGNRPNEELTAYYRELQNQPDTSLAALQAKADTFITQHPTSPVCLHLIDKYFVQQPRPDMRRITALIDRLTGELKDRPYVEELQARLTETDKVAEGKSVPFFRLPNVEGKQISRSDFKDQYLLIHFWASWDSLSRAENARYRRLCKQEKKNERFALLGISLDTDRKAWKEAIDHDTLSWEQACDLAGWNNGIARQLGVLQLPASLLLSPTGRIEMRNPDDAAIARQLEKIAAEAKAKKEAEKKKAAAGRKNKR